MSYNEKITTTILRVFLENLSEKNSWMLIKVLLKAKIIEFSHCSTIEDYERALENLNAFKPKIINISDASFEKIIKCISNDYAWELMKSLPDDSFEKLYKTFHFNDWLSWHSDTEMECFMEDLRCLDFYCMLHQQEENENIDSTTLDNYINSIFFLDRTGIREYSGNDDFSRRLKNIMVERIQKESPELQRSFDLSVANESVRDAVEEKWKNHKLGDWKAHGIRNFKLFPPFVVVSNSKIPKKIKELYKESRECFIFGSFRGSIVLSRAVIEAILKDKFSLSNSDKEFTAGILLSRLLERQMISHDIYSLGDDIVATANGILHQGERIKEEKAMELLNKTREFIEEIY